MTKGKCEKIFFEVTLSNFPINFKVILYTGKNIFIFNDCENQNFQNCGGAEVRNIRRKKNLQEGSSKRTPTNKGGGGLKIGQNGQRYFLNVKLDKKYSRPL